MRRSCCKLQQSAIFLADAGGAAYHAIVAVGEAAEAIKATAVEAGVGIIGSLLQSGEAQLINDTAADPRAKQIAGTPRLADERLMVVPLLAGAQVLGAMAVWRNGGQPFEQRELEFLVGLSRQATVALHNARLFDETRKALERQTATSEVLRVISGSITDAQPVFDIIAERSARLTAATLAFVFRYDGEWIQIASSFGADQQSIDAVHKAYPMRPGGGSAAARAVRDREVVNLPDLLAEADMGAANKELARVAGIVRC